MLFFCRPSVADVSSLAARGLEAPSGTSFRLWPTLEGVPSGTGPILVVDPWALNGAMTEDTESVRVPSVPPEALCNVEPYRPPQPVAAAGGYVGRQIAGGVALLVIYRRGVWDLPKGTQDPGESIEACAWREVREEVGIDTLTVCRPLGTTQHGYENGDSYAVKTTYWHLMQTPERSFEPDRREGIQRVAWARWTGARSHMGYETLCRHMDRVEPTVRAALGA